MNTWLQLSLSVMVLSVPPLLFAYPMAGRGWPYDNRRADIIAAVSALLLALSFIASALLFIWQPTP